MKVYIDKDSQNIRSTISRVYLKNKASNIDEEINSNIENIDNLVENVNNISEKQKSNYLKENSQVKIEEYINKESNFDKERNKNLQGNSSKLIQNDSLNKNILINLLLTLLMKKIKSIIIMTIFYHPQRKD